jgi:hypothetical protein
MRSIRTFLVVVGTALSLTVLAPSVAASSPVHPLHLQKECSQFTGQPGTFCTFTSSNLGAIPVGSRAYYYGPELGANGRIWSSVVIVTPSGDKGTGWCSVTFDPAPDGTCAFWKGTGALRGFVAAVNVSVDANGIWFWDGIYLLPRHHDRHH